VLPSLAPGGMERVVIQLVEDASRHGDHVVVAAGPGDWSGRVSLAGGSYARLTDASRTDLPRMTVAAGQLASCIRRLRPEIVH